MTTPTGILFSDPQVKPLSTVGQFQAGCYYCFFVTGSTTPANVYADGALSTPLSQPTPGSVNPSAGTVAASDGRFVPIYLNPATLYRVQLYNAAGTKLEDTDPYVVPGGSSSTGTQASIGQILYPRTSGEVAASITPANYGYPIGNAWRYLSSTQLADVQAFTFSVDCTTALQNWLNASYCSNVQAYLPGGGYLTSSQLVMNQGYTITGADYRGMRFNVYGDGAGSVQAQAVKLTTVIQGNGNFTLWRWDQYLGADTDSQPYGIKGIRFQQMSASCTVPVLLLDVLGYFSCVSECEIWQAGTGDGIRTLEFTQAVIERCTIMNRDWVAATPWSSSTAYTIGNKVINGTILYTCTANNTNEQPPNASYWSVLSRQATGVSLFAQYSAGQGTVRNCSVRGFNNGFVVGDVSGNSLLGVCIEQCDVSNVAYGVYVQINQEKTHVQNCYFEGVEQTAIVDHGYCTTVRDNIITTSSLTIGIDGSAQGGGCVYDGNQVSLATQYLNGAGAAGLNGSTGITVAATQAKPATVTGNQIAWGWNGGSITNAVGLILSGSNAYINRAGNGFTPSTGWTGGSGTIAINDATTPSAGGSGSGAFGYGIAVDAGAQFPRMERGALGLWSGAALSLSNLASNVLTLTGATYQTVTFASSGSISSFATASTPPIPEGHIFVLHVTNGNCTFTQGTSIKLNGTTNYNPSSAGCHIGFIMLSNVAYELFRTAY